MSSQPAPEPFPPHAAPVAPPAMPAPAAAPVPVPAPLAPPAPPASSASPVPAPPAPAPLALVPEPPAPSPDPSSPRTAGLADRFDLGTALVLAIAALTWQFFSYYARNQLPELEASGTQLSRFDSVVGSLPLADTAAGPVVGLLLAIGGLAILVRSYRAGEREPVLQGAVAAVALVSLLLVALLPTLAG